MPSTSTEPPSKATPPRSLRAGTANALATTATTMVLVKRRKRDQMLKGGPVAEMLSLKQAWTRIHTKAKPRNRSCKMLVRPLASMKTTLSHPSKTQRGKRSRHLRGQARFCKTKPTRTAGETRISQRRARIPSLNSSDNRCLMKSSKAKNNSLILSSTLIGNKSQQTLLGWTSKRRRKGQPRKRARSVKPTPTKSQSRAARPPPMSWETSLMRVMNRAGSTR